MIRALALVALAALLACAGDPAAPFAEITGTWGGDDAGLIATDSGAHVHIGCTLGDVEGPIVPDADGRFEVFGTYNVDAFPVNRGEIHPARFTGRVVRRTMTLTVTLTDTARVLGPVILVFGREPTMGPCPICRTRPASFISRLFRR